MHKLLIFDAFTRLIREKMSQITHFWGVKFLAWKSSSVELWTNIMSGLPHNKDSSTYFKRGLCSCHKLSNYIIHWQEQNSSNTTIKEEAWNLWGHVGGLIVMAIGYFRQYWRVYWFLLVYGKDKIIGQIKFRHGAWIWYLSYIFY